MLEKQKADGTKPSLSHVQSRLRRYVGHTLNSLDVRFGGSRVYPICRKKNCDDDKEGFRHYASFGLVEMTENPIAVRLSAVLSYGGTLMRFQVLCVGANTEGRRWIVKLAIVGSCVGKPRYKALKNRGGL